MHPYRVKEYLWLLIVAMFVLIALLSGCSSAPKVQAQKPQYCHTSQTIKTQNGERVNSETTVECTDDQIKRLAEVRLGMAANCGEFQYWMKQGGQDVQRKGISCQKPNGSWEIVNTVGR
jgi:uncharacterized protein YceK